jgi:hypothetical protein
MISLSFTPNMQALEQQIRARQQQNIQQLKAREYKKFKVEVEGILYVLSYEITNEGVVSIYTDEGQAIGSLIRPTLQLNVGQWLLPVAESIDLDSESGYNPQAQQPGFYEIYEDSLPPVICQKIIDHIKSVDFLTLLQQK